MRFTVLFPNCGNIGLVKDVGQIPYNLGKYFGYQTGIASCILNINGDYADQMREHLRFEVITKPLNSDKLASYFYLLKNARKTDWLNLYHSSNFTYLMTVLFRLLNPKGKVYLKLDMDFRMVRDIQESVTARGKFVRCCKAADLISVETECVRRLIQKYTKKKIEIISNGYESYCNEPVRKEEKKNIFLTVGRLGTKQKATEVLLKAFALIADKCDYELRLAGSVERDFQPYLDEFWTSYPHLKQYVHFLGNISERSVLDNEYRQAKIFVLPSRWESFGLVLPEALLKSCRIIVTDEVPTAEIATNGGKFGHIVPADDVEKLAATMLQSVNEDAGQERLDEMYQYAIDEFSWKRICGKLDALMISKM